MDNRTVQVYDNGIWVDVEFKELNKGDRFKLFESTGEPVASPDGISEWIASSNPFTNKYGDLVVNIY